MGATAACERILDGLGQPVNTLTTLAFAVAGLLVILRRPERAWIGVGTIATGIGSFLSHGPMPVWGDWAHDVSLVWLILLVAGSATRWRRLTTWPGLVALGGAFAVGPGMADPLAVGLTGVAVWALAQHRSVATWGPVSLLTVSGVVGRLGVTGGPLCDPGSLLQPHGLWHLAAAAAVAWWAVAAPDPPQPTAASLPAPWDRLPGPRAGPR